MLHRKCGIISSGLMFLFWFSLGLLAIPQFRDEIRQFERREVNTFQADALAWVDYQFLSYMIYFPLVIVQLFAHFVSDKSPKTSKYEHLKGSYPCPEKKASFLRQILFMWFDPMAWQGYRKPLEAEDMWDLNPEDSSNQMIPRFDKYWKLNVEKNANKTQKTKVAGEKKKYEEKTTNVSSPHLSGRDCENNVNIYYRETLYQFFSEHLVDHFILLACSNYLLIF